MPRKARRTRLRGGITPAQHWALRYGLELLPARDPQPWATDDEARLLWRRHRDVLMAESLPGSLPMGLVRFELESFESAAAILALRLDRRALAKAIAEFESCAAWHARNGREQLAQEFQQRAERVRNVIAEMETTNA